MDFNIIATAFLISSILHFGIQKIFIRYNKFDDFNSRSTHKTFATRTGGIGIFLTVFLISLFYYFQGIKLFDYSLFIPLSVMFIVGVYDDFYNADFKLKFFFQIIVAKILIDQGFVITNYNGLFGLYQIPWLLAQLSTIFVFLVVVNAINFIDGIDGLAITEFLKTVIFIEFLSSHMFHLSALSIILIFSILPLYYFNFKKTKKVFLGDSGSLLLGTVIMIYILSFWADDFQFKDSFNPNKTILSIFLLFYPLVDLLRVFTIRIKNKKSPFRPDQNHIHHQILNKTKNQFLTSLIIGLVSTSIVLIYIFT